MTVEGVGVLAFKNFTPDEAFERRLNPQGREPVKIRAPRRFDWALWIGVAAILVALIYGGREFLMLSGEPEAVATEAVETERADMPAPVEVPDALAEVPAGGIADGRGGVPAVARYGIVRGVRSRNDARCGGAGGIRRTDEPAFRTSLRGAGSFQHD